jgi:hypothetical protein
MKTDKKTKKRLFCFLTRHLPFALFLVAQCFVLSASADGSYVDDVFFNETFSDGSYAQDSGWTVLSGSAEVYSDSKSTHMQNHALRFNAINSRLLANTFKPAPRSGKITLNFKAKFTGSGKSGGIYLVDDQGAGYGFVIANDAGNTAALKLEKTSRFAATAQTTASLPVEPYRAGDWQIVSVLWDTEQHIFEFYVNGTRIDTVRDDAYTSFEHIVASGSVGVSLDNIRMNSTPETIIHVLSWWSPIGFLNGRTVWGDYKYDQKKNDQIQNKPALDYPLAPDGVVLPAIAPAIGSDAYYKLQYQAALHSELPKMKEAGYSAVVFDMLCNPLYNPAAPMDAVNTPAIHYKTFLAWLEAAKEAGGIKVGMYLEKVGRCADFEFGYPEKNGQWIMSPGEFEKTLGACIENAKNEEALWVLNGKPALIMFNNSANLEHYSQTAAPHGWKNVIDNLRKTKDFYFIPDVHPHTHYEPLNCGKWSETADAAYSFTPAATTQWFSGALNGQQIGMFNTFTTQTAYRQIPFYLMNSRGYYRKGNYGYSLPEFSRIHNVYMAALEKNAPGILTATWNDFEEENYIAPSERNGSAVLDIYAYYNAWLRTGVQPSAAEENVTICYPVNIPNTLSASPNAMQGESGPSFLLSTSPNKGRVYYWANLRTKHTLKVNDSETVDLPAGLSYGELPGGIAAGAVTAHLTPQGGATERFDLTPIKAVNKEPDDGGIGFRYKRLYKRQSEAPAITITAQPAATTTVTQGSITGSLSVAASVTRGAALSYQWHSNTTNSNAGGASISGATSASFAIPTTLTVGTYYYFCEIRAAGAASVRSRVAKVTVTNAKVAPAISGPTAMGLVAGYESTSTGEYTLTGTAPITVTKTSGHGNITWNDATKKLDITAGLPEGTYPVELKAGNGIPPDAALTFTLTVTVTAVAPGIITHDLSSGTVGTEYNQTINAMGTAPITWSIEDGSLPDGLTLSDSGVISGTPTTAGTFSFTVNAANSVGTDIKTLSITIVSYTFNPNPDPDPDPDPDPSPNPDPGPDPIPDPNPGDGSGGGGGGGGCDAMSATGVGALALALISVLMRKNRQNKARQSSWD